MSINRRSLLRGLILTPPAIALATDEKEVLALRARVRELERELEGDDEFSYEELEPELEDYAATPQPGNFVFSEFKRRLATGGIFRQGAVKSAGHSWLLGLELSLELEVVLIGAKSSVLEGNADAESQTLEGIKNLDEVGPWPRQRLQGLRAESIAGGGAIMAENTVWETTPSTGGVHGVILAEPVASPRRMKSKPAFTVLGGCFPTNFCDGSMTIAWSSEGILRFY